MNAITLYNVFCMFSAICSLRGTKGKTSEPIVFPEEVTSVQNEFKGFPLEMAKKFNEVKDMEEFFNNFVEPDRPRPHGPIISARFGSAPSYVGDIERRGVKRATMAFCKPEPKIVKLQPSDSTLIYVPDCTRVNRCGGCCSHELLSCQPTDSEILQLSVGVLQYDGGRKLKHIRDEVMSVEQHKKCKCDCKIKASDCNPYQRYSKDDCKCLCNNKDYEEKCRLDQEKKIWDEVSCTCKCFDIKDCSTGHYFDINTCKCAPVLTRKSNATATTDLDWLSYSVT